LSSPSESPASVDSGLFVASLWLRIGFIGASSVVGGLLDLKDAESISLSALAFVFFGAALAVFAWRRGLSVLEPVERLNELRSSADIAVSPHMIERRRQS
jgi:hypothetical protein